MTGTEYSGELIAAIVTRPPDSLAFSAAGVEFLPTGSREASVLSPSASEGRPDERVSAAQGPVHGVNRGEWSVGLNCAE